jgi:hypothetical protein
LGGGEGGGGVGGKGGGGGRGEKWTKPCMHIWIIKEKWKKKKERSGFKIVNKGFLICVIQIYYDLFSSLKSISSVTKVPSPSKQFILPGPTQVSSS